MARRLDVRLGLESLETRNMLSATAVEHNDIGYLLDASDRSLDRYSIVNQTWLSSIPLTGAATAPTVVHVDDDGIYAAYGTAVYRYNLNGGEQTHLFNSAYAVSALHTDGNILFVNYSNSLYARFTSVSKTTNTIIASFENYVDAVGGSSISQSANRIFGRSIGISPADVTYVAYNDDGSFSGGGDSPYHGDYPGGSITWTFPGGGKVVDDSGTVYSANSLTRLGSLGTTLDEIDFVGGEVPITRRGNVVTAFNVGLLPTGSATLQTTPREIFVNSQNIIAVSNSGIGGYSVEIVPLSNLNAPEPGQPIDPVGLAYTPDKVAVSGNGDILIFSKQLQSIFRWNPVTQQFSGSVPLIGAPDYMAYSAQTNTAYLAYNNGLIRKIDLNQESPAEVPFASLPQSPMGLATAGKYLFAADPSGAWGSHYTFDPSGALISEVDWNYYSTEYVWSEANQRMYFFRDDTSPNDLLYEEINANGNAYPTLAPGAIGGYYDSPLHTSSGFSHPIRVSPDGTIVVLGSGAIHDGVTLARKTETLSQSATDIAWLGSRLFTVRNVSNGSQVQEWSSSTYAPGNVRQFNSGANSLTAVASNRLLLVTSANGIPSYALLDENLNIVPRPTPVARAGNDQRVPVNVGVTLDGSASFDPDNSPNPLTFSWSIVSGPGGGIFGNANGATTSFVGAAPGEYKLQLTVSDGVYSSTDVVLVTTRLNAAPNADASLSEKTAVAGRISADLNASLSSDPNGDSLTYLWTIVDSPSGSSPTLTGAAQPLATFAANVPGTYKLQVSVSDGYLVDVDTVTIVVSVNKAPVADASLSSLAGVAGRVSASLDASRSADPDGDALIYQWKVIGGPGGATIASSSQKTTSLSATAPGTYTVELTVGDGLLTDIDLITIVMGENQTPVANPSASTTSTLAGGTFPTLDGRLSTDPDADPLTYLWKFVASTNGLTPTVSRSNTSVATLNTNVAGVYAISLTVSDGLKTDVEYVLITVRGNQPPVANASATPDIGYAGVPITLDGRLSHDPDGDVLSYQWQILSSTGGAIPSVASPASPLTSFVGGTGTYLVQLQVTDGAAVSNDHLLITLRPPLVQRVTGDLDGSGIVDGSDFLRWQRGFGSAFDQASLARGDVDEDQDVDASDLSMMMANFGVAAASPILGESDADFDANLNVDGADFLLWQRNFSSTASTKSKGDANLDDAIDGLDLLVWKDQFGDVAQVSNASLAATIPTSASLVAKTEETESEFNAIDALYSGGDLSYLFYSDEEFRPAGRKKFVF